jgi:putative GTP pyrophosphokinase
MAENAPPKKPRGTKVSERSFPGGSKSRVNAAGDAVRRGNPSLEDLRLIEEWRSAHTAVINTFQALLRNRAKAVGAEVAQRLKRKATIFDKLRREAGMDLARMDDVAGCRVIFPDLASLRVFRTSLHNARFAHELRNMPEKYDYVKRPKGDGYRGIHDVYAYQVSSDEGRHLKGLSIELQYRTLTQHTWSTTVEILSHVTGHEPKYHRGDPRYVEAMALASEMFARTFENTVGPRPALPNAEVARRFFKLDAELGLLLRLKALQVADRSKGTSNRHFILMRGGAWNAYLSVSNYATDDAAKSELFRLEVAYPDADVVYVTGETSDAIRLAYKNYFDDAVEFLDKVARSSRHLGILPPVLGGL